MVSTRGPRYKFSEGERVLCYEPDPTKAKVLYDSKVLEVIETKDKRGRRSVEYLIHFQGWNSSWDRCVSEDFVLKDTEENRQLQRDLAEKSQLQLGAYLYRRERKKVPHPAGSAPPAKRARSALDDDASSSSPDEAELPDTDSESSSGASRSSGGAAPPPPSAGGRAHITLPPALRDRLTFDYHLVVKRGRLSLLPAQPTVSAILESYVRSFARTGAWNGNKQGARRVRTAGATAVGSAKDGKPDVLDVSRRLNLVREVADGLRIYFDYLLKGHLLYKQELNQYHAIVGKHMDGKAKPELDSGQSDARSECPSAPPESAAPSDEDGPLMPEYAHLPPDPVDLPSTSGTQSPPRLSPFAQQADPGTPFSEAAETTTSPADVEMQPTGGKAKELSVTAGTSGAGVASPAEAVRPDSVARRLRSHKSSVTSQPSEQGDEPMPSSSHTGAEHLRGIDLQHSSMASSASSCGGSSPHARVPGVPRGAPAHSDKPAEPGMCRGPVATLLDKVAKWNIVPKEGTEHFPCNIYGAVHLARLFVKLPDFLNAINMPDTKLKLLIRHIDMFVQYLDEHGEWFGETYYFADSSSRSH